MALDEGTKLGPYEIQSCIGAGGMGEVYRAIDPRIGREIAIKVLPEAFAQDAERLARFEREARAAGMLSHPAILAVHDVGHDEDVHYLVTELLEGETLRHKLGSPLPQRKITEYALQIAKGLAAAHDKGIIHRDLKPENLFVTADGRVKILDFGLAKLTQPDHPGEFSNLQTVVPASTPGAVLGTVGYMSPEQVRGKVADHRSDIFSFGVILYEMITGRRAFQGDSAVDTMSAILNKEPPEISESNPNLSPAMARIVEHCMEKNPAQRFQSMHDVAFNLETLTEISGTAFSKTPPERISSRFERWIPWFFTFLTIIGAVAWIQMQKREQSKSTPTQQPQRFAIQLGADQEIGIGSNSLLAFSPDGHSIVFNANINGRRILIKRKLNERLASEIAGTDAGEAPFFSPDGKWVGFISRGQMMKVPADGGRPIRLAEALGAGGATWLRNGMIVYAPIYSDGLFLVAAEGGKPERLTTPDQKQGVLGHWWPHELPGGKWILFTAFRTPVDTSRIGAVNLESREIRWLVDGGFFGRYVPTGHLLYAKEKQLYALPFDPLKIATKGSATAVLEDVLAEQTGGFALVAVSVNGTLAYVTESIGHPRTDVVWLNRAGTPTQVMSEHHRYLTASLSPDGRRAALTVLGNNRDLWIYSFDRGTLSRLTSGEKTEFDPVWSKDGSELFYIVDSPPFELHRIAANAPDTGHTIFKERAERDTLSPDVSPDGATIAFTLNEVETGTNIYTRPIDGSRPPRPFKLTRNEEDYPAFSPDGKWIAYHSDETGRPEIYVEPFPGPGERYQISANGGREPRWAENGEIFFRQGDELRVVPTRLSKGFEFETERMLFTFPVLAYASGGVAVKVYDVSNDGQRILAITTPATLRPRQIDIVTNWTAELSRLVPVQ